jgi:hypothetical protein
MCSAWRARASASADFRRGLDPSVAPNRGSVHLNHDGVTNSSASEPLTGLDLGVRFERVKRQNVYDRDKLPGSPPRGDPDPNVPRQDDEADQDARCFHQQSP